MLLISAAAQDVVDPGCQAGDGSRRPGHHRRPGRAEPGQPDLLHRRRLVPDGQDAWPSGWSRSWAARVTSCCFRLAGASPAEERLRCAREVFAQYPDIKELAQAYTDWSPTGGQKQMEAWITQFGDQIDGIWSDSALQSVGVVNALVAAGMKVPPITGEDWALFLHQAVDNQFPFAAVTLPEPLGYFAVTDALDLLQGSRSRSITRSRRSPSPGTTWIRTTTRTMSDALWLDMLPEVRMEPVRAVERRVGRRPGRSCACWPGPVTASARRPGSRTPRARSEWRNPRRDEEDHQDLPGRGGAGRRDLRVLSAVKCTPSSERTVPASRR